MSKQFDNQVDKALQFLYEYKLDFREPDLIAFISACWHALGEPDLGDYTKEDRMIIQQEHGRLLDAVVYHWHNR